MKSLILFLSFMSVLLADTHITVPSGATLENAKIVAVNGWNYAEKPLNEFFAKNGAKFIKTFLQTALKPYGTAFQKDTTESINQIPKLYLTRSDNYYALAYARFLENQNRSEEALQVYMSILTGLKRANEGSTHMMGVIYSISIERITTESLKRSIDSNVYSDGQKKRLHSYLKSHLILSDHLYAMALQEDRHFFKKVCEQDVPADIHTSLILYPTIKGDMNNNDVTNIIPYRICDMANKKIEEIDNKINQISNEMEYKEFKSSMQKDQNLFLKKLTLLGKKSPNELKNMGYNIHDYIEIMSNIFVYKERPSFNKTYILENIEANKKFLITLWLLTTQRRPIKNPRAAF